MSYATIKMTQYTVPAAEAFNLLGEKDRDTKRKKEKVVRPVTHIKSRVTFTLMTDDVQLPVHNVPMELISHLKYVNNSCRVLSGR